MKTKAKRGRPEKARDEQLRHYAGIRYDDETKAFIDAYRAANPRLSEAEVWRRGIDMLRKNGEK